MLNRKIIVGLSINIVILFIIYMIIIGINYFKKVNQENLMIAGINPIVSTKSIMANQNPLTVLLKEKVENELPKEEINQEEEVEVQTENAVNSELQEEAIEEQKQTQNEDIEIAVEEKQDETPKVEQEEQPSEYKGFATVGKIEIPKISVDIPILDQVTVKGMENAPCLLYSTGDLNQDGNNLIVGHNYRNGTIFSNNKYLNIGDKIYITTLDNKKIEYTIYQKFITTAEDISYIKRDTFGKPEITLSCCTDDDEQRIIILAKISEDSTVVTSQP